MKRILTSVLVMTLCLAGCSWSVKPDAPQVQIAKIAVQLGVAKFIAKVPEDQQAARADRIASVVHDIESIAKGEDVTLSFLEAAIRKNLPPNLKPEDRVAVNALAGLIVAELRARVGEGVLKPEQVLAVSLVASWITDACELYGA